MVLKTMVVAGAMLAAVLGAAAAPAYAAQMRPTGGNADRAFDRFPGFFDDAGVTASTGRSTATAGRAVSARTPHGR